MGIEKNDKLARIAKRLVAEGWKPYKKKWMELDNRNEDFQDGIGINGFGEIIFSDVLDVQTLEDVKGRLGGLRNTMDMLAKQIDKVIEGVSNSQWIVFTNANVDKNWGLTGDSLYIYVEGNEEIYKTACETYESYVANGMDSEEALYEAYDKAYHVMSAEVGKIQESLTHFDDKES